MATSIWVFKLFVAAFSTNPYPSFLIEPVNDDIAFHENITHIYTQFEVQVP